MGRGFFIFNNGVILIVGRWEWIWSGVFLQTHTKNFYQLLWRISFLYIFSIRKSCILYLACASQMDHIDIGVLILNSDQKLYKHFNFNPIFFENFKFWVWISNYIRIGKSWKLSAWKIRELGFPIQWAIILNNLKIVNDFLMHNAWL